MKKTDPVQIRCTSLSRHRWHGSSGLHSEQLLQTSRQSAYTQVLCFKTHSASSDKDNSLPFPASQISAVLQLLLLPLVSLCSFSGPNHTRSSLVSSSRCTARSSCAPSFTLPHPQWFSPMFPLLSLVLLSRTSYDSPLLLCLLLDILGLKERYRTIVRYTVLKYTKAKPLIEDTCTCQWTPDTWTNSTRLDIRTCVHIFTACNFWMLICSGSVVDMF